LPVEYPGRGHLSEQPAPSDLAQLSAEVYRSLRGHLEGPVALYGHSMGALVAFELARCLAADRRQPVQLIISACPPPDAERGASHRLSDNELASLVPQYGLLDEQSLLDPIVAAYVLPRLRADLQLFETYRAAAGPLLHCPVVAIAGRSDRVLSPQDMAGWGRCTTGTFQRHDIEGTHSLLHSSRGELVALVRSSLIGALSEVLVQGRELLL
jgi:surfactin synthase thioesterase subunit